MRCLSSERLRRKIGFAEFGFVRLKMRCDGLRSIWLQVWPRSYPTMNNWYHIPFLNPFSRQPRGTGCVARSARRRQGLLNCLVLGLYLLANIGLPVGSFTSAASAPGIAKGCRCSDSLKSAGRCCCAQRSATPVKRGCCATKPTVMKSCCSTKGKPAETRSQPDPRDMIAAVSECPCGPGDSLLYLVCAQPRILVACASPLLNVHDVNWLTLGSVSPCGERERPFVPPPEVLV